MARAELCSLQQQLIDRYFSLPVTFTNVDLAEEMGDCIECDSCKSHKVKVKAVREMSQSQQQIALSKQKLLAKIAELAVKISQCPLENK